MKGETTMKKLAMKMLSLLLVLSLLLPTCVFAQPGQDGDGTPGTQGAAMENADAPTGGGNGDENTKDVNGDETSKDENGDGNTKDVNGGSVTQSTTSEKTTTFTEGEDGDTPTEEPIVATVSIAVAAEDDDDFSQEELLEGYLYSISGLYGEGAAVFRAPSAPLSGELQTVYAALQPMIRDVAGGSKNEATFALTNTWTKTKAEWGFSGNLTETVGGTTVLTAEAANAIQNHFKVDELLQRLLSTMPYDLYWFDKTEGMLFGFGAVEDSSGNVIVSNVTYHMAVSSPYSDPTKTTADSTGKTYVIGVDTGKTGATTAAVNNAKNIVSANSTKRDYEKLKKYLSEICNRVEYNHAAAGSSYTGGYGDPWQLIYVFDGNDTTNVVCEGYAKAFKYLCDLSAFSDTNLSCYLVTGTMSGGTGEGGSGAGGGHMWNVVHIGGNNYLVDVTNCDTGTIGETDKLFLCGVQEDVASEKYTATKAGTGMSRDVVYEYDAQTMSDYTADELKLSGVTYTPPAQETPTVTGTLTAAVTFGDTVDNADIKSTGVTVAVGSTTVAGEFQWDGVTSYGDAGTKTLNAKFVPADSTKYTTVACTVSVTVSRKTVNNPTIEITPDSCKYTGSAITPTVTVKDGGTVIPDSEYSLNYTSNTNVGTASVAVVDSGAGNYYLTGTLTKNFTITLGEIPAAVVNGVTGYSGTYDGNPHNAVAVNPAAISGYTLAYKGSGSATYSSTMPQVTDVAHSGDVWVKLSKTNYADKEIKVTAKVDPKALTNDMITLGTQKTYDGNEQSVQISSVKDGTTPLISMIDYTIVSGNKATDVGNNKLKITGTGNYMGEASAVWSLVARDVTITPDVKSKTYGEADPELTFTTSIDGNTTLKNKFLAAKSGAMSRAAGEDVGSYAIKLGTLMAGNNFNLTFATTTVYLAITPKNVSGLTATISNQTTIKGVGEFVDPVIKGVNGEDLTGTLTYAYDSVSGKTHADVVAMLKTKVTNDVVTLNYTFAPPSGNYTGTKTGSFTVTVKDIEFLVGGVTATVGNTLTVKSSPVYGDDWSDIVKIKDGVTITAKVGTNNDTDPSHFTLKQTGKPGVGSQAYTLAYNGTINGVTYSDVTVLSGTVTVAQKDVTITGLGADNKVYDGNDTATITGTAAVAGKVGSDDVTVTGGTATFADKNVGTGKTVNFTGYSLSGTAAGNYNLTAQPASVTADITAREVTITSGITATNRPYEKNNTTVNLNKSTLTFTNLVAGETLDANVPATGTVDNANVGTGKNVTYSGVTLVNGSGMASNYKLVGLPTVTVNITKAAAPTAPTGLTGVKGNALSTVTLPSGWTWVNGSTVMNTVGSQTFKANYTDAAGNYASATDVNVTVNVMNKTDVSGKISFNDGTLVYTGAGQRYETASISGITAGMGVTWTYGYTAGTGTLDSGLPKTVGTYTVTVTYEDNLHYGTKSVTLTITQATPTGAPKFTKITSSGKTLGDAALVKTVSGSGDGFSVAGTVEWVDGSGAPLADSTSVEANKSYGWKFTPTDSNYKSISGSVVVYTVRRVSHSGGAAADSAAAAAAQPTVYSGSRGESVKTLQEKLNAKGFNAGSVDGIFGKNTQAAVMAFQKANGLAADGIVGKLTWAKLYDTTAALPAASTATGTQPMVYRGSRGDAVRRLQELLHKKGFDCGAVDGIFGSKTYAAVVAFQKANGLGADGIVGPLTWGKLG